MEQAKEKIKQKLEVKYYTDQIGIIKYYWELLKLYLR